MNTTTATTATECACKKDTCYSCRRQHIDATAARIFEREIRICTGMTGFNVTEHAHRMAARYRTSAINALAFEFAGMPVATAPRVGCKPTTTGVIATPVPHFATFDPAAVARSLRAATSPQAAHELLRGLTMAQVKAVAAVAWTHGGLALGGRGKAAAVKMLVHFLVEVRLSLDTVRGSR